MSDHKGLFNKAGYHLRDRTIKPIDESSSEVHNVPKVDFESLSTSYVMLEAALYLEISWFNLQYSWRLSFVLNKHICQQNGPLILNSIIIFPSGH